MIEKHSTAIWTGSLKEGAGKLDSQSGVLSGTPYTFATRFENGKGCNPEELVAAAHSSCYAMFLSALMSGAGIVPETVEARSTVKLDPTTEGGPTVMAAHLDRIEAVNGAVNAVISLRDREALMAEARAADDAPRRCRPNG